MKARIIVLLCFITPLFAIPWQQAVRPFAGGIEIGLRDKFGDERRNGVVVVEYENGLRVQRYSTRIVLRGDAWSRVVFPHDFRTRLSQGDFRWWLKIGNQIIESGRFRYYNGIADVWDEGGGGWRSAERL